MAETRWYIIGRKLTIPAGWWRCSRPPPAAPSGGALATLRSSLMLDSPIVAGPGVSPPLSVQLPPGPSRRAGRSGADRSAPGAVTPWLVPVAAAARHRWSHGRLPTFRPLPWDALLAPARGWLGRGAPHEHRARGGPVAEVAAGGLGPGLPVPWRCLQSRVLSR